MPRPRGDTSAQPTAWPEYWRALGQPWRLAPEIDDERQRCLETRRRTPLDLDEDIGPFPFAGVYLDREDVEW